MTTGQKLRRRREELGLTIRKLAYRSGISAGWIYEVEEGVRKPYLNCDPILFLARALEVLPEDLHPDPALPRTTRARRS